MKKLKCDIGWCKKMATHFYFKGSCMGYYYTKLTKNDISYGKQNWLKFCDFHENVLKGEK